MISAITVPHWLDVSYVYITIALAALYVLFTFLNKKNKHHHKCASCGKQLRFLHRLTDQTDVINPDGSFTQTDVYVCPSCHKRASFPVGSRKSNR